MVFTVLTLGQMGHALAVRSERDSLFAQVLLGNLPMIGAVLLTTALQLALIYVPALNTVFHTPPLNAAEIMLCIAVSGVVVEVEKMLVRRGWLYAANQADPARKGGERR